MFATAVQTSPATPTRRTGRLVLGGFLSVAIAAASVAMMGGSASAAPGDQSTDTVTANVGVESSIALTGLTSSFTLNGLPGATVTDAEAVMMNVNTNNIAGYTVTVQAATSALVGDIGTNTDTIPISALSVVDSSGDFAPLSVSDPVTVYQKTARSATDGDSIVNGYRVAIPFVNDDVYSGTLNYIATTL